jgi:hypothetical protein
VVETLFVTAVEELTDVDAVFEDVPPEPPLPVPPEPPLPVPPEPPLPPEPSPPVPPEVSSPSGAVAPPQPTVMARTKSETARRSMIC